jgi:hypothetical protein
MREGERNVTDGEFALGAANWQWPVSDPRCQIQNWGVREMKKKGLYPVGRDGSEAGRRLLALGLRPCRGHQLGPH